MPGVGLMGVGLRRRSLRPANVGPPPVLPTPSFTGTPLSGNEPLSVTLTSTSANATGLLFQKSNGGAFSNFTNTTTPNPVESFANGTWSIKLIATNANGTGNLTRTDYVASLIPAPSLASVSNQTLNLYGNTSLLVSLTLTGGASPVVYSAASSNITVLGNASVTFSGNTANLTPSQSIDGNTTITITATDALNRTSNASFRLSTYPNIPTPSVYYPLNGAGTVEAPIINTLGMANLTANVAPSSVYVQRGNGRWLPANISQIFQANATPIASSANESLAYSYFLNVRADAGTTIIRSTIIGGGGGQDASYLPGDGTITRGTIQSGGAAFKTATTSENGRWVAHHVYENWTGNVANISIDGYTYSACVTANGIPIDTAIRPLTLGAHADGGSRSNIYISDLSIWRGVANIPSVTQVARIAQNGRGRVNNGTVWAQSDSVVYPTGRLGSLTLPSPGRWVILDIDTGEDMDDYRSEALSLREHILGNISLRGIVVTSTIDKAAACAWVLANYAGCAGNVPIYAYQGGLANVTPIVDNYAANTATQFGNTTGRAGFPDSTTGYFNILSNATDGNVTVIAQGYLSSLNAFVQSSPANKTLFNQKVGFLVLAATSFPSSAGGFNDYNIAQDYANAVQFFGNTTIPRLWSVDGLGRFANVGASIGSLAANNPLRFANGNFAASQGSAGNFGFTRAMWGDISLAGPLWGTLDLVKFTDTDITNVIGNANGCNAFNQTPGNDTVQIQTLPQQAYIDFINAKFSNFPLGT